MAEGSIPLEVFTKSAHSSAARVAGTAIFMASASNGVPSALLHNIKHNKVLHNRVVILTVQIQDEPYVDPAQRSDVKDFGNGFYRLKLRFGFLEETDVPAALKTITTCGEPFDMMKTSFFLSRQTLIPSDKPGMACGAKSCLPGCCATRPVPWNSSACRPTAWSNWAASCGFDRKRRGILALRRGLQSL
jgi:KUP system potassium uptake protein